jgi:hypothetical protein
MHTYGIKKGGININEKNAKLHQQQKRYYPEDLKNSKIHSVK